jgi:hypothetical protein
VVRRAIARERATGLERTAFYGSERAKKMLGGILAFPV